MYEKKRYFEEEENEDSKEYQNTEDQQPKHDLAK